MQSTGISVDNLVLWILGILGTLNIGVLWAYVRGINRRFDKLEDSIAKLDDKMDNLQIEVVLHEATLDRLSNMAN